MDSVKHSSNKSKLARTFAKVLHIQAVTKKWEKVKDEKPIGQTYESDFFNEKDEKLRERAVMDAFIAQLFATISSVKSAYAQLQYSQFPYDGEGIQAADKIIVSELKSLSELKQSFLKKHLNDSDPETTLLQSEIQEQKNLLKTYEITRKKLNNQTKLKDSEIIFLQEKLEESRKENKLIEKRLNSSSPHENFTFSSLTPTNFLSALKQATKSIRNLVKFMITEMESANWDLEAAVDSIHPEVRYSNPSHICYAFESFICQQMFDGFNLNESNEKSPGFFFDKFMELKSLKPREYIKWQPTSMFSEFCRLKYLKLIHPKMEASLFGNLNQRNLVNARKLPETSFFDLFLEVAKRVFLLQCLAYSFEHEEVTIFQVKKGNRFSEVFMESVNDEVFMSPESSPEVAFTVVPGFKVGKTVIQCQVYLISGAHRH